MIVSYSLPLEDLSSYHSLDTEHFLNVYVFLEWCHWKVLEPRRSGFVKWVLRSLGIHPLRRLQNHDAFALFSPTS